RPVSPDARHLPGARFRRLALECPRRPGRGGDRCPGPPGLPRGPAATRASNEESIGSSSRAAAAAPCPPGGSCPGPRTAPRAQVDLHLPVEPAPQLVRNDLASKPKDKPGVALTAVLGCQWSGHRASRTLTTEDGCQSHPGTVVPRSFPG